MTSRSTALDFSRIAHLKACEALANQLREMILSGILGDGDTLPSERDIGQRSGISRASVREALRILEADGLLRTRPGRKGGAVVRRPQPSIMVRPIELLVRGRNIPFRAVLETREAIEPPSAGLAARYRTNEDVEKLRAISRRLEENLEDVQSYLQQNLAWHMAVVEASHNELMIGVMQALSKTIFAATDIESFNSPEVRDAVVAAHRKVEEAIVKGDVERASRRMGRHLHAYSEEVINYSPAEIEIR